MITDAELIETDGSPPTVALTGTSSLRRRRYRGHHIVITPTVRQSEDWTYPQVSGGAGGVRTHDLTDYESATSPIRSSPPGLTPTRLRVYGAQFALLDASSWTGSWTSAHCGRAELIRPIAESSSRRKPGSPGVLPGLMCGMFCGLSDSRSLVSDSSWHTRQDSNLRPPIRSLLSRLYYDFYQAFCWHGVRTTPPYWHHAAGVRTTTRTTPQPRLVELQSVPGLCLLQTCTLGRPPKVGSAGAVGSAGRHARVQYRCCGTRSAPPLPLPSSLPFSNDSSLEWRYLRTDKPSPTTVSDSTLLMVIESSAVSYPPGGQMDFP